ncbi:hypothetical protein [Streptomyces acidicola]|uniref:hypothetical protein n=1 Tax=Streptomyces acidicola TaxID=2596892 RepID=UPI001D14A8EE|nr:hypothetical protein [Streptomyces acidicola]
MTEPPTGHGVTASPLRRVTEAHRVQSSAGTGAQGLADRATPPFSVVLGTDYAGKSAALKELAGRAGGVRIVSADEELLDPGHSLIARLRRGLVGDVMPALHHDYSADFMLTMLQTAVLHLRDSIMRSPAGAPVLVDSYYYKMLAKCRLTGLDEHPLFDWWRSFPRPQQVIFLEVSAETAWRRCGEGRDLNPLEHYGQHGDRASFESFQADLNEALREEVRSLPVSFIGEQDQVSTVAQQIQEVLGVHELV